MQRTVRHHVSFLAAVLAVVALTACSSLRPITSDPPASAVLLFAPFSIEQFSKATFPSGEYRALYEDDGGYYYQAPTKIVANALFSYLYDGGLYVKRGATEPTDWFVIGQGGRITMGPLTAIPPHQMKQ
jgi:hypothetical protein